MITLEHIQKLEAKVGRAVDAIKKLKDENNFLREKIEKSQSRIQELENLVNTFKEDQEEIENRIENVLNKLDKMEDDISESEASPKTEDSGEKTLILDNQQTEKSESAQEELDIF